MEGPAAIAEMPDRPGLNRPRYQILYGCLIALLGTAVATAFCYGFWDTIGGKVPFLPYFIVVTICALYGGYIPGFFATFLGGLAGYYIFVPPPYGFSTHLADLVALATFLSVCIITSILCESLYQTQSRYRRECRRAQDELQERVELQNLLARITTAQMKAEERFRIAQEVSMTGFVIANAIRDDNCKITDFCWDYINPAAAEIMPDAAAVGKTFREIYRPSKPLEGIIQILSQVIETGDPVKMDFLWDTVEFRGWLALHVVKVQDGVAISFDDITREKEIQKELELRIEEMAQADRRKDEFLAILAHELRNPLAPLRNALQIMRIAGDRRDLVLQARETMDRQVDQLVRLVDDLLDISRINYGKITLNKTTVETGKILQDAIDAATPAIDAAGIRLHLAVPCEPLPLNGDSIRLVQIFSNILNNAIKYTPRDGDIFISAEKSGHMAIIKIRDTGPGIDPAILPRIFDIFCQGREPAARIHGGLGIGLALVKRLVELHGGAVVAASEGRNKGSEFTVTLPLAHLKASAKTPPQESLIDTREHGQEPAHHPAHRIVVIDDNKDAAETLGLLLKHHGADVRLAFDGESGLELIEDYHPDLAIVDIGLPEMSGHDVVRHLRGSAWGKNIRCVALSGWGKEDDKKKSREAGFDNHLVKPVSTEEIEQLLAG